MTSAALTHAGRDPGGGIILLRFTINEKLRALPYSHECSAGAAAGVRSNIFYIFPDSRI